MRLIPRASVPFYCALAIVPGALAQAPQHPSWTGSSFLDKGGMHASVPQLPEAAAEHTYVLGPADVITVSTVAGTTPQVYTVPVGPDGFITVPLIGGVKAAGQTRTTLALEIGQKLKEGKIYVDPNVTVNVVDYNSRLVYITGSGIARPGPYPLVGALKVSELIAKAGGLKEWAKAKDILIVRGKQKYNYNEDDVSLGKHLEQDIALEPGDHVNVR